MLLECFIINTFSGGAGERGGARRSSYRVSDEQLLFLMWFLLHVKVEVNLLGYYRREISIFFSNFGAEWVESEQVVGESETAECELPVSVYLYETLDVCQQLWKNKHKVTQLEDVAGVCNPLLTTGTETSSHANMWACEGIRVHLAQVDRAKIRTILRNYLSKYIIITDRWAPVLGEIISQRKLNSVLDSMRLRCAELRLWSEADSKFSNLRSYDVC